MKYVIDIDGTICKEVGEVIGREPYLDRIAKINKLYDEGHTIVFYTARGLKSGRGEPHYRPITEQQFESLSEEKIINEIYTSAIKNYQLKSEVNAKLTYPIIKNVYENPNNKYEKIVVPFSDGSKTLNVVTNLEDAYKSEGKTLVDDFERNITLALIDNSWKNHLRKMD